jgi:hypothetical protein
MATARFSYAPESLTGPAPAGRCIVSASNFSTMTGGEVAVALADAVAGASALRARKALSTPMMRTQVRELVWRRVPTIR